MKNPLQEPVYPSSSGGLEQVMGELAKQREMLEEQGKMIRSIRRSLRLSSVFGFLRLLLIVVPLILLAVYLPPLLKNWIATLNQYQQSFSGTGYLPVGIDFEQLQNFLQKSGFLER